MNLLETFMNHLLNLLVLVLKIEDHFFEDQNLIFDI